MSALAAAAHARVGLATSLPNQKPCPHHALALDNDLAPFLEHEMVLQPVMDHLWHLDLALDAGGLHS